MTGRARARHAEYLLIERARILNQELVYRIRNDLDLAFEDEFLGVSDLAPTLHYATALSAIPDRDLSLDRELERNILYARDLARSVARERVLAGAFATNYDVTHRFIRELMETKEQLQRLAAEQQAKRATISTLATRATDAAARLLPPADRVRYAEEYRCELYELAQGSRRAQWAYALRLLVCAVSLRRELRRDAREAAGG